MRSQNTGGSTDNGRTLEKLDARIDPNTPIGRKTAKWYLGVLKKGK